jgi:hypothetical protein
MADEALKRAAIAVIVVIGFIPHPSAVIRPNHRGEPLFQNGYLNTRNGPIRIGGRSGNL